MKVLLIDFEYSRLCSDITNLLIAQNHECITALALPTSVIPAIKIGNSADRKLHRILAGISDSMHLHSARATYNLLSRIPTQAPDIVHILNIKEYYLNLPLLSEILTRFHIPTVMTVANPDTLYKNPNAIATSEALLFAWDTLNIVVENRVYSEHPILVDKPVYIIDSTSTDRQNHYLSLYENLS